MYEHFRRVMENDPPFEMPEFWDESPDEWFDLLEECFVKFRIRCEKQKFLLTLRYLQVLPIELPPSPPPPRTDFIANLKSLARKQLKKVKRFIERQRNGDFYCCCIRADDESTYWREMPNDLYLISNRQTKPEDRDLFITIANVMALAETDLECECKGEGEGECEGGHDDEYEDMEEYEYLDEEAGAVGGVRCTQKEFVRKTVPREGGSGVLHRKVNAKPARSDEEFNSDDEEIKNIFSEMPEEAKALENEDKALKKKTRAMEGDEKPVDGLLPLDEFMPQFSLEGARPFWDESLYTRYKLVYYTGPLSEMEERCKGMNIIPLKQVIQNQRKTADKQNKEYYLKKSYEILKEKHLSGLLFPNSHTKTGKKGKPVVEEETETLNFSYPRKGKN